MFCSIEYSDIWKFIQYIIHNINIHKVLKNGPKNKTIPSFDGENHAESKYIIRNEF